MSSPETGSSPLVAALTLADRLMGRVSIVLAGLGCVCLGALALLIGVDVTGRALGRPVPGTVQLASTSVVAIVFLLMPYALRRRGHVRSTIIRDRLPDKAGRAVDFSAYALGAVVFALILMSSWEPMIQAWASGEYRGEGALRVPEFPTRAVLVLVSGAMVLECALAMIWSLARSEGAEG